jgi:cullin-associated NEDD8-dissociated protein 1
MNGKEAKKRAISFHYHLLTLCSTPLRSSFFSFCLRFNEYSTIRGEAALSSGDMLLITSPNSAAHNTQPCTKFGVNPALTRVQQMYAAGDAAFVANVGTLVEPLDRVQYAKKLKSSPASLFAHNAQQQTAKTVHAGTKKKAKGILGRIAEALTHQPQPYAAAAYSMSGIQAIFDGQYPAMIVGDAGGTSKNAWRLREWRGWSPQLVYATTMVPRMLSIMLPLTVTSLIHDFFPSTKVSQMKNNVGQATYLKKMLHDESNNKFSETYSHLLNRSIEDSKRLGNILDAAAAKPGTFPNTKIGRQLKNAAAVILARGATGSEREMFYAQQHGFDSHFKYLKPGSLLSNTLKEVDDAIKAFETQMKAEGIWDDVLVVSASDFGRKLVSVDDVYVCDCVCVCVCVCVFRVSIVQYSTALPASLYVRARTISLTLSTFSTSTGAERWWDGSRLGGQ